MARGARQERWSSSSVRWLNRAEEPALPWALSPERACGRSCARLRRADPRRRPYWRCMLRKAAGRSLLRSPRRHWGTRGDEGSWARRRGRANLKERRRGGSEGARRRRGDRRSDGELRTPASEYQKVCTQRSWKRPYGVGLLVAGLDESGAHLYYNCPSGNYFEYQAFTIGSRSQAARTFLERRFQGFNDYTPEQLVKDALSAIKETLQGEKLTSTNCTVAIVGRKDDGTVEPFHMIDATRIQEIMDSMEAAEEAPTEPPAAPAQEEGGGGDAAAPMDI